MTPSSSQHAIIPLHINREVAIQVKPALKDCLDEIEHLITRRHLKQALQVCRETAAYYPKDITCRKQLYLVCLMLREAKMADQAEGDIKHLTNDPLVMGDLKRDAAIACVWQGGAALQQASKLIEDAVLLHKGDVNRLACLKSVRGRWHRRKGNVPSARAFFEAADADLTDPQWRFNNKIHWQAAACQAGKMWLALRLGFTLLRGLRQHGSLVHVPVILAHCVPGGWRCIPLS